MAEVIRTRLPAMVVDHIQRDLRLPPEVEPVYSFTHVPLSGALSTAVEVGHEPALRHVQQPVDVFHQRR